MRWCIKKLLTSCNLMHFVLYEEVDQGHQRAEEQTGQDFSVFDCSRMWRTESKTPKSPWQCCNQIGDHENVMPVMVIRRCHVRPSSTSYCPEQARPCDNFRQGRVWPRGEEKP